MPPPPGFETLRGLLDRSIRDEAVKRALGGLDFTRFRDSYAGADAGEVTTYYAAASLGFELGCTEGDVIKLVSLYAADVKAGFDPYRGPLLGGLTLADGADAVLGALGPPAKRGGEQLVPTIGRVGPWSRWDLPDLSVHVQFRPRGRAIAAVTLLAPDRVP